MTTNSWQPGAQEPDIRNVEMAAVGSWLLAGWRDFRAAPVCSLVYGLLFTTVIFTIVLLSRDHPGFSLAFFSGLLLLGPFLAAGTYVASRQMEAGEKVSISTALPLLLQRARWPCVYCTVITVTTGGMDKTYRTDDCNLVQHIGTHHRQPARAPGQFSRRLSADY